MLQNCHLKNKDIVKENFISLDRRITMGLARCPEGHMFSERRYGTICPYCHKAVRLAHDNALDDLDDIYSSYAPHEADAEVLDPVIGWLVCIGGPSKGRDYKIFTAKNFVGSADNMDVQIIGDDSISKKNHAILIYDPKGRGTVIMPGDSKGLVYVNDILIYAPQPLGHRDIVELGKSRFIFISLCDENFEWNDLDSLQPPSNKPASDDKNQDSQSESGNTDSSNDKGSTNNQNNQSANDSEDVEKNEKSETPKTL